MKTYYAHVILDYKETKKLMPIEAKDDDDFDVKIKEHVKNLLVSGVKVLQILVWTQKPTKLNLDLIYKDIKSDGSFDIRDMLNKG